MAAENTVRAEFFESITAKEFFNLFADEQIGKGVFRTVFRGTDKTLVLKYEHDPKSFCNVNEWQIWNKVKNDRALKRWFAPCVDISPCGTWLVQKYAENIKREQFPKRVPAFLTDFQVANWGKFNGRIVCRDYGHNLALDRGISRAMRKPYLWKST
jgi:hypothetical protein